MKVMHLIHGLNTGGAETLVKEYVMRLDKSKFEPIVLCYNHYADSPYEKLLGESGIRVIYVCDYIKPFFKKTIIEKVFNKMQRYYYIRKVIHSENPDIIHTHLLVNKYVKFAKPKKGTKIFHTVHAEPKQLWSSKHIDDYKSAKWLVKRYGMIFICLHEKMKDEVNKMYSVNNSIVLNNGVDISKYKNIIDIGKIKKELKIPVNSFIIGHVGRFSEVKNHKFLIAVFNEIYKINKNAFLLMIGDGANKNLIQKELKILGLEDKYLILSNRSDIPDLLRIMNIFVFPSYYEGLGISLIEAQMANLPCFVSDKIPNSAFISNLIDVNSLNDSPKKWAKKILKYENVAHIEKNEQDWDINNVIKRLEDIYLGTNIL